MVRVQFMGISKLKVIGYFKTKTKKQITLSIPADIYNDIEYFFETCKLNGTDLKTFLTIIFVNSYTIYKQFMSNGISSLLQMNYVVTFFSRFMREIIKYSENQCAITLKGAVVMKKLCEQHNIEIERFSYYIETERYDVVKDKVTLTDKDIQMLFKRYLENGKYIV